MKIRKKLLIKKHKGIVHQQCFQQSAHRQREHDKPEKKADQHYQGNYYYYY
ncbi:MAG: hypothetical protein WC074_03800 [bacterium]